MDLASFKSLVQDELENTGTEFSGVLDDLIRIVEREIYIGLGNSFITRFTYDCLTAPTAKFAVANQRYIDIPGALDLESIYVANSSDPLLPDGWRQLQLRDQEWLDTAYGKLTVTSQYTGRPKYYAIYQNQQTDDNPTALRVLLAPVPNINYLVRYTYYAYPTSLVDSPSDVQGTYISNNYTNVLLYGVMAHAYLYEKGDAELMQMYKDRYDFSMSQLMKNMKMKHREDAARDGQV